MFHMKSICFYLILAVISAALPTMCLSLHINYSKSVDSIISIVGSIASVVGIVVAIWQIHSLKNKTEAVSLALKKAREDMSNLTIFAEVNKHSQFINEIEQYVRSDRHSEALITYKDLKEKLTVLAGYIQMKDEYVEQHRELRKLMDNSGGDIKTLTSIVLAAKGMLFSVDKENVLDNLEKIKTFLDNTPGMLKGRKI